MSLTQKGQVTKQMLHSYWIHCTIVCNLLGKNISIPFIIRKFTCMFLWRSLFSVDSFTRCFNSVNSFRSTVSCSICSCSEFTESSDQNITQTSQWYVQHNILIQFIKYFPYTTQRGNCNSQDCSVLFSNCSTFRALLTAVCVSCNAFFSSLWRLFRSVRENMYLILYGYINSKVRACWLVTGTYLPLLSGAVL